MFPLFFFALVTIEVPLLPLSFLVWHLVLLVRAWKDGLRRPVAIWLVVFVLLSLLPFVLPTEARLDGPGPIQSANAVRLEHFLIEQVFLNFLALLFWRTVLRKSATKIEA